MILVHYVSSIIMEGKLKNNICLEKIRWMLLTSSFLYQVNVITHGFFVMVNTVALYNSCPLYKKWFCAGQNNPIPALISLEALIIDFLGYDGDQNLSNNNSKTKNNRKILENYRNRTQFHWNKVHRIWFLPGISLYTTTLRKVVMLMY